MRSIALVALAATSSVLLAACGSSGSSSSGASKGGPLNSTKALAFAKCMRTHGVPSFPDPVTNGHGGMQIERTPNSTKVNGVTVNGPAFQTAMQACRADLPNSGHPQPLSAAQRQKALAWAACMRQHGLPNFPDPGFGGGGQITLGSAAKGGIDPQSPAFKSAQAACGSPLGGKPPDAVTAP
jgi:hypothetical protein